MLNAIRRWFQGAVASTIVKQAAYIESLENEADRDLDRYTRTLQHNLELIQTRNTLTSENKFLSKANLILLSSLRDSYDEVEELLMRLADANRYYEQADDKAIDLQGKLAIANAENKTLVERLNIQDKKVLTLVKTVEDNDELYQNVLTKYEDLEVEAVKMRNELDTLRKENKDYKDRMTEIWKSSMDIVATSSF